MIVLTKAQRQAVFKVFRRDYPERVSPFKRVRGAICQSCGCSLDGQVKEERVSSRPYRAMRVQLRPYCDGSGCVMLPWKGMWLGIERDGYTHS